MRLNVQKKIQQSGYMIIQFTKLQSSAILGGRYPNPFTTIPGRDMRSFILFQMIIIMV